MLITNFVNEKQLRLVIDPLTYDLCAARVCRQYDGLELSSQTLFNILLSTSTTTRSQGVKILQ